MSGEKLSNIRRATLMVGYGPFGRAVLERLLASAAPRGVLEWQEPPPGAGAGERTLRDLALIHVPDRLAAPSTAAPADAGAAGLLGDLYRQIRIVEPRSSPEQDLADVASAIAEQLLSASVRAGRGQNLPLGLDVIVLARPETPEVLGILDRMLAATLDTLANNANLVRAVTGAQALSLLEILDFENFWDAGEPSRRVRRALAGSLEQWQHRRAAGRPSPGRVYLVDGRTADGIRDARHRVDETSLFLELLLFEGQRDGELQRLWQPVGLPEPPLAVFGVRSVERSAGLLSRLAAARFAVDWLEDLAGAKPAETTGTELAIERLLAPYRGHELEHLLATAELRGSVAVRLAELETELAERWCSDPEKLAEVRAHAERAVREIAAELAAAAGARLERVHRERLASLREDVETALSADLHHTRQPLPLGAVVRRLEQLAAELAEPVAEDSLRSGPQSPQPDAPSRLSGLAERYLRFRRHRAAPAQLRQGWPLWAAVLAAGSTPLLAGLIRQIPPPDTTRFLLTQAHQALQGLGRPLPLGVLLLGGLWALGNFWLQRRLETLQARADAFYRDPRQGRFAAALRTELGEAGSLGAALHRDLDDTLDDLVLAVRGELSRELDRALEHLRERRREMLWLREELRDFLTLHGVDLSEGWHRLERRQRDDTGVRTSVEHGADLERVLRHNPPSPERFRSTQSELRPFEGWQERYSAAFLYPLAFLDRLARLYDPVAHEGSVALADPSADFLRFLESRGSFDLAFAWKAQQGVPVDRRYGLLPAAWQRLGPVRAQLAGLGITEDRLLAGADATRAYLLRFQSGIARECLDEATPASALRQGA